MRKIFIAVAFFIGLSANANPDLGKWKEELIEKGRKQLQWQQEENANNDRLGHSELNKYLIVISSDAEYPDGDFITQRNSKALQNNYLLDLTKLQQLDLGLRDANLNSAVKTYLLVVHYMPLIFKDEVPDQQTISGFFNGKKLDDSSMEEMRDEAASIVASVTQSVLNQNTSPTLYCGFVNFKFYKSRQYLGGRWVYYPRSGKVEFDEQYKNMLRSSVSEAKWKDSNDLNKVEKLVEVLKKNNDEYAKIKGTLANILSITDASKMEQALTGFSTTALSAFTASERIYILKILSSGTMSDGRGTLVNNLLAASPAQDIDRLLVAMMDPNDKVPSKIIISIPDGGEQSIDNPKVGWCLLRCITHEVTDKTLGFLGENNYKTFIQNLVTLCKQSSNFKTKADLLRDTANNDLIAQRTIFYHYNSIWVKLGSSISTFPNPKIDRNTDYFSDCKLKTDTKLFFSYFTPNAPLSSEELSPFEPVIFVNNSSLDMLADLDKDATDFISPAIVLKYADDKAWNQTATDATMAAIDAASLATGYGEIKAGVTGLRKAWTLFDIANSTVNLTLNITLATENPKVKEILNWYNFATGGIALSRMATGGLKGVYQYTKGKQLLKSENIAGLLKSIEDGGEDALKNFPGDDLKKIETVIARVKSDANARGLTNLEQQADRVLNKINAARVALTDFSARLENILSGQRFSGSSGLLNELKKLNSTPRRVTQYASTQAFKGEFIRLFNDADPSAMKSIGDVVDDFDNFLSQSSKISKQENVVSFLDELMSSKDKFKAGATSMEVIKNPQKYISNVEELDDLEDLISTTPDLDGEYRFDIKFRATSGSNVISVFVDTKNYSSASQVFADLSQIKAYFKQISSFDGFRIVQQNRQGITLSNLQSAFSNALAKDVVDVFNQNPNLFKTIKRVDGSGLFVRNADDLANVISSSSFKNSEIASIIKITN